MELMLGDAVPSPSGDVELEPRFPASGAGPVVEGRVRVRAGEPLAGVVAPGADVFLARDGVVVSLPLPQDLMGARLTLAAGEETELPAVLGVLDLVAGPYQLHARLAVSADDGSSREFVGEPVDFTVT